MGSICSSSQSTKDSVSVKSEEDGPEKTKEEQVNVKQEADNRKVSSGHKTKAPFIVESEYSSQCDESSAVMVPGAAPSSVARPPSAAPPAELPTLASLSPELKTLLEGGLVPSTARELERGKSITLYVCATDDSAVQVRRVQAEVIPHLRLMSRTLGWELTVAVSPLMAASNTNRPTTSSDVIRVASSVLTGDNRSSYILPVIFLHDSIGELIPPHSLPASQFNSLQEAVKSQETDLVLLRKWYSCTGVQRQSSGAEEQQSYFLTPAAELYLDYESRDASLRQEARSQCKQDLKRLRALLEKHLGSDCLTTSLETEVQMLLIHDLAAGSVWVNTCWQDRPVSDTSVLHSRMVQLQAKLQAGVPNASIVQTVLPWPGKGVDPDENYISQLCSQLTTVLSSKIEAMVAKHKNPIESCRSVQFELLSDLQEHQSFYSRLEKSTTPRPSVQDSIKRYLESSTREPLGVYGAPGAGTTSQLVHACVAAKKRTPGLVIVMRTVGVSAMCCNVQATVQCTTQHCCALFGGSAADCTKGNHRTRHLLEACFNASEPSTPLLMVIDQLTPQSDHDWLPSDIPQHVKLILSTSEEHKDLLTTLCGGSDALIQIPAVGVEEVPSIAQASGCRELCCKGTDTSFLDSISSQMPSSISPLQIQVAVRTWQLTSSSESPRLLSSLDLQIHKYCGTLEALFGKVCISHVLGSISASVRGLCISEVLDLLSVDPDTMKDIFADAPEPQLVERYPSFIWLHLMHCLEPFLCSMIISGTPVLHWRHTSIASVVRSRYLPSADTIKTRCDLLVDYFQGKYSNNSKIQDKTTGASTDRRCLPQPFIFQLGSESSTTAAPSGDTPIKCCNSKTCGAKCQASNRRRVDEEPHAVLRSCSEVALPQMIEKYTLDHEWLLKKLSSSSTEQVISDIDVALGLCKDSQKTDLEHLKVVLRLSAHALDYDYRQFYAQVYGRLNEQISTLPAFECCHIRKLLGVCSKPPIHSLLPTTPCFIPTAQVDAEEPLNNSEVFINQLSRLPTNTKHMLALSTDKSQLMVWDFANKRLVRTLKGLHLPRKFEMIDDFQCLLLCGRELRIYNLDSGELVMKFREVMNQKMPFFGLNRPDHVVALSRSRMYVNMMNISNGECVATFKVGEDRFLNSLTVSENGKTCVCGDDTQKASALLVWDLSQRKLLYDLRIPHHEFLTRLAAITSEGHYVACVCRETEEQAANFLVVYDLESGTLFKRWKPGVSSLGLAISTPGVSVVAALEDATIMAYDLVTGNPRWCVKGHSFPADTIRLDPKGSFVVTYDSTGRDRAVRVWDMQSGVCKAVWSPDSPVTACQVSSDSRALVVALAGRPVPITLVLAHKTLPSVDENKTEEANYGEEANRGKEYDVS